MRRVLTIWRRELRSYFDGVIAYVVLIAFYLFASWYAMGRLAADGRATLRPFFDMLPVLFLFFVPALGMRLWSEERKLGTVEVLLTWPVSLVDLVVGKFLAGLSVIGLALLMTLSFVAYVYSYGDPDSGPIIGGYHAALMLGGCYLSIACFVSSLTENQIVAFVVSVFLSSLFFLAGFPAVLGRIPPSITIFQDTVIELEGLVALLGSLGFGARFDSVARGVLDFGDLRFYVIVMGLFLYLNCRSLAWQRLKGGSGHGSRSAVTLVALIVSAALCVFIGRGWRLALVLMLAAGARLVTIPERGRRVWLGRLGDSLLASMLAVVLALQLIGLSDRGQGRFDLTEERAYSLSDLSRDMVAGLEDPLAVRCYFSGSLPPVLSARRQETLDLLKEYQTSSRGKMTLTVLDPDADPEVAARASRDGIKKSSVTLNMGAESARIERFFGCVFEYAERRERFAFMPVPSSLEAEVTATLRKLESERSVSLGVVTSAPAPSRGLRELEARLKQRRSELRRLDFAALDGGQPVPRGLDLLLVIGPSKVSERAAYELDQFVMRGGALVLLVDGVDLDGGLRAKAVVTGLEGMLARYGFEVPRTIVRDDGAGCQERVSLTVQSRQVKGPNPFALRIGRGGLDSQSPVTKPLDRLGFLDASPVIQLVDRPGVTVLARASPSSRVEGRLRGVPRQILESVEGRSTSGSGPSDESPAPTLALAYQGPLESAFQGQAPPEVQGLLGAPKGDGSRVGVDSQAEARLVIVGDSSFIEPDRWLSPYGESGRSSLLNNLVFVLNCIDWLTSDADLIALRSRGLKARPLAYPDGSARGLATPVYFGPPALLLLLGLIHWLIVGRRGAEVAALRALAAATSEPGSGHLVSEGTPTTVMAADPAPELPAAEQAEARSDTSDDSKRSAASAVERRVKGKNARRKKRR